MLHGANLSETDLSGSILNGTKLLMADLRGAIISLDDFNETDFSGVDLSQTYVSGIGLFSGVSTLTRSIEFPPAYRQAAVGILGYFREVLHHKSPDIQATVRIEQEDLTVRLVILTDEGHRETVEQTLDAYGLVVTGHMPPETLLSDPLQLMDLKHRLEMSQMEVRFAQEQLRLKDQFGQQQQARIDSLEEDVNWFKQHLGESLRTQHHVQTHLVMGSIQALTALVNELTARQTELQLASEQQSQLTKTLQTLREELRAPQPNHIALQQALATVRNILEGAAGSLLASQLQLRLASLGKAIGL